jgi:hypothetical protein
MQLDWPVTPALLGSVPIDEGGKDAASAPVEVHRQKIGDFISKLQCWLY